GGLEDPQPARVTGGRCANVVAGPETVVAGLPDDLDVRLRESRHDLECLVVRGVVDNDPTRDAVDRQRTLDRSDRRRGAVRNGDYGNVAERVGGGDRRRYPALESLDGASAGGRALRPGTVARVVG